VATPPCLGRVNCPREMRPATPGVPRPARRIAPAPKTSPALPLKVPSRRLSLLIRLVLFMGSAKPLLWIELGVAQSAHRPSLPVRPWPVEVIFPRSNRAQHPVLAWSWVQVLRRGTSAGGRVRVTGVSLTRAMTLCCTRSPSRCSFGPAAHVPADRTAPAPCWRRRRAPASRAAGRPPS